MTCCGDLGRGPFADAILILPTMPGWGGGSLSDIAWVANVEDSGLGFISTVAPSPCFGLTDDRSRQSYGKQVGLQ